MLKGRPWNFENNLILLKEIKGNEQPEHVTLTHSLFWVRILKLPFNYRSDEAVRGLVEGMGEIMEMEEDVLGLERFRRVRIILDVRKPIRRTRKFRNSQGELVQVEYKYERLSFFCLACGVIGHSERDCMVVSKDQKKKGLGWSLSLRASPRKGYSKEVEEVKEIISGRLQLFVTKEKPLVHPTVSLPISEGTIDETRQENNTVQEQSKYPSFVNTF